MERICNFLKEAGVYYLATVEGDQPRVRPFGTAIIYEGNNKNKKTKETTTEE